MSTTLRRVFLQLGAGASVLLWALGLPWGALTAAEGGRLPNVIVIFIDDMGYADVGPFGATAYKTPNLDRMAKEGRLFTDFYVTQAVCSASRAGLLTGCYNVRVGILGALGPKSKIGIGDDEMTLAEVCKQKNYATAATASGTSAIARSSCRCSTGSTITSACRTRTTCGPTTPL